MENYEHIRLEDIVESEFEASAMHPAHCVYNYKSRRELIFCFRGTTEIGDIMTDSILLYLTFEIYQNKSNGQCQLKIVSDVVENVFETGNQNIDIFGLPIEDKECIV